VFNPPKSPDSSVDDPDGIVGAVIEVPMVPKFLFIPKVPLSLILEPAGGGYAPVRPRALDILPILTSDPVAGICPIILYLLLL